MSELHLYLQVWQKVQHFRESTCFFGCKEWRHVLKCSLLASLSVKPVQYLQTSALALKWEYCGFMPTWDNCCVALYSLYRYHGGINKWSRRLARNEIKLQMNCWKQKCVCFNMYTYCRDILLIRFQVILCILFEQKWKLTHIVRLWAAGVRPLLPLAELDWARSHHIGCRSDSQLCVIITHLTQSKCLVQNMNEEDKNTGITANQSLAPERIINASTPINVRAQPSLTDHNYLICGCLAPSHLQDSNLLPFRGDFML